MVVNGKNHPHRSEHNGSRVSQRPHSPETTKRTHRVDKRSLDLHQLIATGRDLPRQIVARLQANPAAAFATVGVGSFLLGALLSSRLGRLVLAAAVPYAITRVFESELGQEIGKYAEGLIADVGGEIEEIA
jgi:hypothetical protein